MNLNTSTATMTGVVPWVQRVHDDLRSWIGPQEWPSVIGPTSFFVVAVTLLTYDHTTGSLQGHELIFWTAMALIVGVFAWMLVRVGEASRSIANHHLASFRDEMSGLGSALRCGLTETSIERQLAMVFVVVEAKDPEPSGGRGDS